MYPLVRRVVVWPFLVAVMAVSALACRVDATVTVDVVADGSGTVAVALELDAGAVEALGGLDGRVHVDDLVAAGWKVTGPTTDLSGGGQISAVKPFDQPSHLGPVWPRWSDRRPSGTCRWSGSAHLPGPPGD